MKTIYLVRHGDYDYRDTRPETEGQGLVSDGLQQAQLTADWFGQLDVDITALYSSDYLRARQTAEAIASVLKQSSVQIVQELRECSDVYYQEMHQPDFPGKIAFEQHFSLGAAEDGRHEILVCHANLIRYFLSRINGWSKEEWRKTMVSNCSISQVCIERDGTFVVPMLASDAHLPDSLRESLDDFF